MQVNYLKIDSFRNIDDLLLTPTGGANIICGNNAQGKTNILEAMWLFTGSRSFRGNKEKEFMPTGTDFAGIELGFNGGGRDQISTIRWKEEKKKTTLNEVQQVSVSALAGMLCGIIFSPDHLSFVKAGPSSRRSMIDASLFQAYPKYLSASLNYNKALKQRNALLKDISFNSSLLDMLEVWDEHIVNYGAYISAIRDRYIKKLSRYSMDIYSGISGNSEKMDISYLPNFIEGETKSFELNDYKLLLKKALIEYRGEDIRQGITSAGPHRDDLDININGLSARSYGSQGQQRSSVLALKLAECAILEEQIGEPPVIMLDDVMSELDKNRRSYLLNKLKGKQVFITCCDTSVFEELGAGKIIYIDSGKIVKEEEVN